MKGDNPARGDGDLLTGFGVPTRPLVLVAEIEIPEAGQMDAMTFEQGGLDRIKEQIHEFT
jgi:hypothetical protein